MVKRKYVEDSDGEGEEDESPTLPAPTFRVELSQSELVNPQNSHAPTDSLTNSRSIERSTASTEVLNREIASAYDRLMQPTPENIDFDALHRNASQHSVKTAIESRSKMKRALSNMESPSPSVKYGRQTSGTTRERDLFDFHGSSDGEVGMSAKARKVRNRVEWSKDVEGRSVQDKRKVPSIFAEFAAEIQSSHSEGRLPNPATSSRRRACNVELPRVEQASKDVHANMVASLSTLPASEGQEECSSSASFISPSKTIVAKVPSPKPKQLQYDEMEDELAQSENIRPFSNNPIVLLPQPVEANEDPVNGHEAPSESEDDIQTNRIRKRKILLESMADELGSENVSSGIPQENYSKRPTRSRSSRGHGDLVVPADFSKKPETVAKAAVSRKSKFKRSKTTAFQELRSISCDEEDEEDILISGNTAAENTARSKKKNWQNPTTHIEPEAAGHDESVTINLKVAEKTEVQKSVKKRGRPKKGKAAEETKSSVNTLNDDEEDRELAQEQPSNELKSADSDVILEDRGNDDGEDNLKGEIKSKSSSVKSGKILAQTTGNSTPAQQSEDPPKPESSPGAPTIAPETPKKSEKAPGKNPDQHSPISNGKVAYRVGLSKRARIEPLLRIVRK